MMLRSSSAFDLAVRASAIRLLRSRKPELCSMPPRFGETKRENVVDDVVVDDGDACVDMVVIWFYLIRVINCWVCFLFCQTTNTQINSRTCSCWLLFDCVCFVLLQGGIAHVLTTNGHTIMKNLLFFIFLFTKIRGPSQSVSSICLHTHMCVCDWLHIHTCVWSKYHTLSLSSLYNCTCAVSLSLHTRYFTPYHVIVVL